MNNPIIHNVQSYQYITPTTTKKRNIVCMCNLHCLNQSVNVCSINSNIVNRSRYWPLTSDLRSHVRCGAWRIGTYKWPTYNFFFFVFFFFLFLFSFFFVSVLFFLVFFLNVFFWGKLEWRAQSGGGLITYWKQKIPISS